MFENVTKVLDWFKTLYKPDHPVTVEVGDKTYAVKADGTLGDVVKPVVFLPQAPDIPKPTLLLSTLSGLAAVVEAGIDDLGGKFAVQVVSHTEVRIVSLVADDYGRRHVWAKAECAEQNPFPFGNYIEPEDFLIRAQAGFLPEDGHFKAMLQVCSTLKAGSSIQTADDGYSQKVTLQEGGVERGSVELPPRVTLKPYRTFREVTPVDSDFLLRFKAVKDSLPNVALIPVDGGRWKMDSSVAIGEWLKVNLPDGTTIIA